MVSLSFRKVLLLYLVLVLYTSLLFLADSQGHKSKQLVGRRGLLEFEEDEEPVVVKEKKKSANLSSKNQTKLLKPKPNQSMKNQTKIVKYNLSSKNQTKIAKSKSSTDSTKPLSVSGVSESELKKLNSTSQLKKTNSTSKFKKLNSTFQLKKLNSTSKSTSSSSSKLYSTSKSTNSTKSSSSSSKSTNSIKSSSSSSKSTNSTKSNPSSSKKSSDLLKLSSPKNKTTKSTSQKQIESESLKPKQNQKPKQEKTAQKQKQKPPSWIEQDEEDDLVSEIRDLPNNFQKHLIPDLARISTTSKAYITKYNKEITKQFKPIVGNKHASTIGTFVSCAFLFIPLILVSLVVNRIKTYFSLQKILIFIQVYLSIYFSILCFSSVVTGLEPLKFFYATSQSTYICLQVLQTLGYVLYLLLLLMYLVLVFSTDCGLGSKLVGLGQTLVGFAVGVHYYVAVFHRVILHQPPKTNWKIHGIYATCFLAVSICGQVERRKKAYLEVGGGEGKKH